MGPCRVVSVCFEFRGRRKQKRKILPVTLPKTFCRRDVVRKLADILNTQPSVIRLINYRIASPWTKARMKVRAYFLPKTIFLYFIYELFSSLLYDFSIFQHIYCIKINILNNLKMVSNHNKGILGSIHFLYMLRNYF